jgi:hypothetical protein
LAFERVDWKKLIQDIEQGTCTPFIGAGACSGHFPLAGDLAQALAEDEAYPIGSSQRDLAAVAQYMAVNHANGTYPKREVARFFGFQQPGEDVVRKNARLIRLYESRQDLNLADEDDPHVVLANIKSAVYLTTNYDDFLFKAVKGRASANGVTDPQRDLCRWTETLFEQRRSPFDAAYDPTRKKPVIYHLHGHADVPESIVITEDDYTDFIVNISSELSVSKIGKGKKERLPVAIRNTLRNNTLLFVGYHVADQNLRVILRLLSQKLGTADQRLNVAIQLSPTHDPADLRLADHIQEYLEKRYAWSLRMQVYWGDAREFARELRKQMNNRQRSKELDAA